MCVNVQMCIGCKKRNLYRLLNTRQSYQDTLHIDNDTAKDLQWWYDSQSSWNGLLVGESNIECQMITAASSSGWGAWIPGKNAQGFWNNRLSNKHSNYRELFAVLMGLHSFKEFLIGKIVQVLSDNVTTVAFLQMGGSQKELDSVARANHILAMDLKITLSSKFVSGKMNWRADQLSRVNSTYEWMLHPNLFRLIYRIWGATSDSSFCVHVNDSARDIKLDVLGPVYIGRRRIRTKRLDQFKQLCQRSLRVTEQTVGFNTYTQGFRNCDRAILARSGLVSKVTEYGDRRPNQTTSVKPNSYRSGSKSGTVKEQGMDHLCLETLWGIKLRCLGWRKHVATRTVNSLADSTLRTYNSYINRYISFCTDQKVDFFE